MLGKPQPARKKPESTYMRNGTLAVVTLLGILVTQARATQLALTDTLSLRAHTYFLSRDLLRGRATGSVPALEVLRKHTLTLFVKHSFYFGEKKFFQNKLVNICFQPKADGQYAYRCITLATFSSVTYCKFYYSEVSEIGVVTIIIRSRRKLITSFPQISL